MGAQPDSTPGPDQQRRVDEQIQRGQQHHQKALQALRRGHRDLAVWDFERAIAEYSEVLRIDPGQLTAYLYRARAYEAVGDDEKAEADLASARKLEQG
jgi:Tfp pilus assembly protein PilF